GVITTHLTHWGTDRYRWFDPTGFCEIHEQVKAWLAGDRSPASALRLRALCSSVRPILSRLTMTAWRETREAKTVKPEPAGPDASGTDVTKFTEEKRQSRSTAHSESVTPEDAAAIDHDKLANELARQSKPTQAALVRYMKDKDVASVQDIAEC